MPQDVDPHEVVIHFGKYSGQRLGDIDDDYLVWMFRERVGAPSFQERLTQVCLDKGLIDL